MGRKHHNIDKLVRTIYTHLQKEEQQLLYEIPSGLNVFHLLAMTQMDVMNGIPVEKLDDLPSSDKDNILRTMEYLETKGFVTYLRSGHDKHSQLSICLTEQGKMLINDILAFGQDAGITTVASAGKQLKMADTHQSIGTFFHTVS